MAKKRTIVGYPLVPDLLGDLNLLQGFPETPADFDPNGQWTNTYRIMTCHGYREEGNEDIGLLRLSKSPDTDDTFRLQVDREIVNDEHRLHKYAAEIICRKDLSASPVSWRLSNQFTAPNQSEPRTLEETGKANGTTAEITINNRTRIASGANPITADWCLFEAVQRLPFESSTSLVVDILEGLSVHKYNQHLSYRGLYTRADNSLQWFHQIGHGVLPYEYWLDNHHRLQMVTTGARTYILSDDAEARLTHQKTRGTRAFKRRHRKYAGGDRDA